VEWLRNYRYKGLTLIFISILFAIFLSKYTSFDKFLFETRYIPFIGSFIAGVLYVSSSTAALGILIFSDLSLKISPVEIALLGGLGSAVSDFFLFRFFKDDLLFEITPIYNKLGGRYITKLMYHKFFRWSLPIIGAIIIASPLPDEIGISLMGISKIKNKQFAVLSLTLNTCGIFILASVLSLVK